MDQYVVTLHAVNEYPNGWKEHHHYMNEVFDREDQARLSFHCSDPRDMWFDDFGGGSVWEVIGKTYYLTLYKLGRDGCVHILDFGEYGYYNYISERDRRKIMANYVEYNGKIAFHPGYYIEEFIVDLGTTQKEFAERLDTSPTYLSAVIKGEESLSIDLALRLSKTLRTTANYWVNLQKAYDAAVSKLEPAVKL